MYKFYLTLILGLFVSFAQAQITAPDTACIGSTVNYSTTASGNTYAWAPGNVDISPTSMTGIPGCDLRAFGKPMGISMQQDASGDYYAFVTLYKGGLLKIPFGSDPTTPPSSSAIVNYGNLGGLLGDSTTGIDIVQEAGNWYGFIISGKSLIRVDFGNAITNNPSAHVALNKSFLISNAQQLTLVNDNGTWRGFTANQAGFITRFDFATITSTPTTAYFGSFNSAQGGLNAPASFSLFKNDLGSWMMIVANRWNGFGPNASNRSTLSRFELGTNLANNSPSNASNLGQANINGLRNVRSVTMVRDCDQFYTLVTTGKGDVSQVDFGGLDPSGTATYSTLGSFLYDSVAFVTPFWYDKKLCIMASCVDSNLGILSNVYSIPANSSVANTNTGYSASYNAGGVYTTTLYVDQAKACGPQTYCKDVYSLSTIRINIRQYDTIFVANGTKCDVYVWQKNGVVIPGAVTDTLTGLEDSAVYTVIGYKAGCSTFSTVQYFAPTGIGSVYSDASIAVYPNPSTGVFNINATRLSKENVTISCYNMVGSLVKFFTANAPNGNLNTSIDLAGLPKGVYQLKLQTEDGNYIKQVVLQ
ncbi:MAG: T9SS type A sorting domain-containing protein [Bacteroidetes bacterium]|nr:T9SS type A sorting domain-containing protein [Bacteroidota bacterium]